MGAPEEQEKRFKCNLSCRSSKGMVKCSTYERQHNVAFKVKVSLEPVKGDKTITQIASTFSIPTRFVSGAQVFVYPSVYEGFGLPVLEALSCGTPVVTSNISSMPEILGDAGLLVDPYNVSQLADAILRIVDNDDFRRSMQERGLQRAAQFSWEKTARKTINVYLPVSE